MACANPAGYHYGRYVDGTGTINEAACVIPCNKWTCESCREHKAKEIMARALKGRIVDEARKAGFREKYYFKLLTLTVPGAEYRKTKSPDDAAKDLRDNFRKLLDAIKKEFGVFSYIRVIEAQRDGFPHYHVLLCGEAIAAKNILQYMQKLWCEKYGMGFLRLNVVKQEDSGSVVRAVKYILKYLFKDPTVYERMRMFATSKGAIEPPFKSERVWLESVFRFTAHRGISHAVLQALVEELLKRRWITWRFEQAEDWFSMTVDEQGLLDEAAEMFAFATEVMP